MTTIEPNMTMERMMELLHNDRCPFTDGCPEVISKKYGTELISHGLVPCMECINLHFADDGKPRWVTIICNKYEIYGVNKGDSVRVTTDAAGAGVIMELQDKPLFIPNGDFK